MYEQTEKPKKNINMAVSKNKSSVKECFGIVDNRPKNFLQRKIQSNTNNNSTSLDSSSKGVIQKVLRSYEKKEVDNPDDLKVEDADLEKFGENKSFIKDEIEKRQVKDGNFYWHKDKNDLIADILGIPAPQVKGILELKPTDADPAAAQQPLLIEWHGKLDEKTKKRERILRLQQGNVLPSDNTTLTVAINKRIYTQKELYDEKEKVKKLVKDKSKDNTNSGEMNFDEQLQLFWKAEEMHIQKAFKNKSSLRFPKGDDQKELITLSEILKIINKDEKSDFVAYFQRLRYIIYGITPQQVKERKFSTENLQESNETHNEKTGFKEKLDIGSVNDLNAHSRAHLSRNSQSILAGNDKVKKEVGETLDGLISSAGKNGAEETEVERKLVLNDLLDTGEILQSQKSNELIYLTASSLASGTEYATDWSLPNSNAYKSFDLAYTSKAEFKSKLGIKSIDDLKRPYKELSEKTKSEITKRIQSKNITHSSKNMDESLAVLHKQGEKYNEKLEKLKSERKQGQAATEKAAFKEGNEIAKIKNMDLSHSKIEEAKKLKGKEQHTIDDYKKDDLTSEEKQWVNDNNLNKEKEDYKRTDTSKKFTQVYLSLENISQEIQKREGILSKIAPEGGIGSYSWELNFGVKGGFGGSAAKIGLAANMAVGSTLSIGDDRRFRSKTGWTFSAGGEAGLLYGLLSGGVQGFVGKSTAKVFRNKDEYRKVDDAEMYETLASLADPTGYDDTDFEVLFDSNTIAAMAKLKAETNNIVFTTVYNYEKGVKGNFGGPLASGGGKEYSLESKFVRSNEPGMKLKSTTKGSSNSFTIGHFTYEYSETDIENHKINDNDGKYKNYKITAVLPVTREIKKDADKELIEEAIEKIASQNGNHVLNPFDHIKDALKKATAHWDSIMGDSGGSVNVNFSTIQYAYEQNDIEETQADGKKKYVKQYSRHSVSETIGISAGIETSNGVAYAGIEGGVSLTVSKMISESLGEGTMSYVRTVYNGYNYESGYSSGKKTPWKDWKEKHKDKIETICKKEQSSQLTVLQIAHDKEKDEKEKGKISGKIAALKTFGVVTNENLEDYLELSNEGTTGVWVKRVSAGGNEIMEKAERSPKYANEKAKEYTSRHVKGDADALEVIELILYWRWHKSKYKELVKTDKDEAVKFLSNKMQGK